MKLSEILRAGKQRIETEGWCQGDEAAIGQQEKFGCCAGTAIPFIDGGFEAISFLKKVNGIDPKVGIAIWNDAPERTLAEVLAAYDKAITAAEAQEQAK